MATIGTTMLGSSLTVSNMGFGAMAFAPPYGGIDSEKALATLHHTVDLGVTFIDTADVYGAGDNERLLARFLKDRRDDVTLATKFGIQGETRKLREGGVSIRGDRTYVHEAADASLQRLGIDTIDLYYMHRRDMSVPIEETVGAMSELVTAGKVRHLGLSEVTAEELGAAHAVHPISAVQSEWSIWSRDVETQVVPAAAALGVGFVPYSPLGRGFLTGTVTDVDSLAPNDFRRTLPRFAEGTLQRNLGAMDAVKAVADKVGATPAQIALAWLYAQGAEFRIPVVPIPGTRRAERVDENAGALDIELSKAQMAVLNSVRNHVEGARSQDPQWISQGRES
ncbi:aldo/keto reductase [Rhodococcus sp. WMMA185]|uniref:aldo/keto reductase n=1 Tax=Rhodococcus sp. WMMA185 TaxID=679318 RepID=UPI0008790D82|nr:aldo/keto reductase [Rhodococcus sp. WMMA185]AOW91691.1 aldo/keto reductase [Rhodococcus sp. WMMA185]